MDDNQTQQAFLGLSQALTGISGAQLAPRFDPKGTFKDTYTAFMTNAGTSALMLIFSRYRELVGQGLADEEIARQLVEGADTSPIAGSIIKLWLLGNWYAPGSNQSGGVVSSNAYIDGWVWKIMQAHPMGYSMLEYGYWSKPSAPLDQYIKPTTKA